MKQGEHPDRQKPTKIERVVRAATCQKCGAVEPKPALNAVCELLCMAPWNGRCVNGVYVKEPYVKPARRTNVGRGRRV